MFERLGALTACAVLASAIGTTAYLTPAQAEEPVRLALAAGIGGLQSPFFSQLATPGGTAMLCADKTGVTLAQLKLKSRTTGDHYVTTPGQRRFTKLAEGTGLGSLDCIEIEFPASFPPDATCWRCREQIKAPDSGN